ncbi:MAG: 50S ribosomal protein L11 methyltransferase [Hyphomicrobiaceae bacterium]
MTTYALSLDCASAAEAEAVATALDPVADVVSYFEAGDAGRWSVSAYFEVMPDEADVRGIVAGAGCDPTLGAAVTIASLPETDWVAESQRRLPPVHAGGFVIHGSHDRDSVPHSANAIEIDAGAAFGTAHHGTTVGCLEAIDRLCRDAEATENYRNVLDLGTGSAVLAIAVARRLPSARILATDIDRVAIDVATENARINQAGDAIRFCVADGFGDAEIDARQPFDLIIANILAGPLVAMAGDIAGALSASAAARIVLSGLLDEQADTVMDAYRAHDLCMSQQRSRSGWATLVLQRA